MVVLLVEIVMMLGGKGRMMPLAPHAHAHAHVVLLAVALWPCSPVVACGWWRGSGGGGRARAGGAAAQEHRAGVRGCARRAAAHERDGAAVAD
jgi:hypothetical protein